MGPASVFRFIKLSNFRYAGHFQKDKKTVEI